MARQNAAPRRPQIFSPLRLRLPPYPLLPSLVQAHEQQQLLLQSQVWPSLQPQLLLPPSSAQAHEQQQLSLQPQVWPSLQPQLLLPPSSAQAHEQSLPQQQLLRQSQV